jgi:hypothetical protein
MKLRLQPSSIRLRLKQSEVDRFLRTGRVEERIVSGTDDQESFRYLLETNDAVSAPKGSIAPGSVIVQVPTADALKWALTNQIGIEGEQTIDSNTNLRILVEKDFACLDGSEEQNADTFPNPLAGQKCLLVGYVLPLTQKL